MILEWKLFIIYMLMYSLTLCCFKYFGKYDGTLLQCFAPTIALMTLIGVIVTLIAFTIKSN